MMTRNCLNILRSLDSSLSFSSCRYYSLSLARCNREYAGSWRIPRLQNPNIEKSMPTYEFVKPEGQKRGNHIYVCGFGATGSLGVKRFYKPEKKALEEFKVKDVMLPTFRRLGVVSTKDKVRDIACGYGFTIVAADLADSESKALGFGLNTHSQLGIQCQRPGFPLEIVATPSTISLPTRESIVKVSCGRTHTVMLDSKGKVFSLGNNSLGQCGRPIDEHEIYFGSKKVHRISSLPANVSQIECGQDHTFFLTEDGKLFACGWSGDGQTGLGHYGTQSEPKQVRGDIDGAKIVKVSSTADTVLALDDQGNLFGWGNAEYAQFRVLTNSESEQFDQPRQLKLPQIPGSIVDIAAGGTRCAILNDRGDVYVWGFGILGLGPKVSQSSRPTLIPDSLFGRNIYAPDAKVTKIYAGLGHFAAISSTGDLYTWGKNRGQALGFKHGEDQFFPMRVNMNMTTVKKVSLGVDHTCALVELIY